MKRLPVLPPMRCDAGCGDCCGPVPVTEAELRRVRGVMKEHGVEPRDNGPLTCPFLQDGLCAIYEARPLICRIFGHSRHLQCSRGYNVNVNERVLAEALRANGRATALLHSLLPKRHAAPDTPATPGARVTADDSKRFAMKDETGNTYAGWRVLARARNADGTAMWRCQCICCGEHRTLAGIRLRSRPPACACQLKKTP